MERRHTGLKAVLLAGAALAALAAAGTGALAQQVPAPKPLLIDAAVPPASPVVIDGSKIYSSAVIGQNNPNQVAEVTGDTLVLGTMTIGQNATSTGNQVTAASGALITTSLYVGDKGSYNTLDIGADPSAGITNALDLTIGKSAGSTGNQLLIESGNILNYSSNIYLGGAGHDNGMTVSNGGYISSLLTIVGQYAGADGNTASITGAGSLWLTDASNGVFVIGDYGNNNLAQVTDGGRLSIIEALPPIVPTEAGKLYIGGRNGGSGNQLYVANGGIVEHTGTAYIGYRGSNNLLTLDAGGTLSSTSAILGYDAAASGNVADIEFDGVWNIDAEYGTLVVGLSGSNNLVNVNEGVIDMAYQNATPSQVTPDIFIGALGGNGNTLSIGYSGRVSHPDAIYVGENGSGNQLNIFFDGDLATGGAAYIGGGPDYSAAFYGGSRQAADNNIATVDGVGSSWTIGGELYIGAGLTPSSLGNQLIVGHGAMVSAGDDVFLGFDAASGNNLLSVSGVDDTGAPTSFTTPGTIRVGVAIDDNVETAPSFGNMLEAGTATGEYYGKVSAARILIGSGNSLALGGGGLVETGDIAFGSTSNYLVHIDSTARGALNVSGNAAQDGTVAMSFGAEFGNRYVILSTAASTGAFALDTGNLAPGLAATLEDVATATGRETAITFVSSFAQNPNLTANDLAVATSIDQAFNSGSSIPGELATVPAQQPAPAMAMASAPAPMALPVSPDDVREALRQRLSGLTGEVGASGGTEAVMQASRSFLSLLVEHGEDGAASRDAGLWASMFGTSATLPGDEDVGSHDTDVSVAGMAAGWQRALSGDRRIGLAMAGGVTGWSLDGTQGAGDSNFIQFGAYGVQEAGNFYLTGAAGLAIHDISTNRSVTILRTHDYDADYSSTDAALRAEAGYRLGMMEGTSVIPYAALEGHYIFTGGYGEDTVSGRNGFALNYDANTTTDVRSELGLGFEITGSGEMPRFAFTGRAAWAHDWNDGDGTDVSFQAIENASFTVRGAEAPDDVALVNATLSAWVTESLEVSGSATGEFGQGYESLSGALSLNMPF
jgi:uncharacterized protein with beta-barrel porin domain